MKTYIIFWRVYVGPEQQTHSIIFTQSAHVFLAYPNFNPNPNPNPSPNHNPNTRFTLFKTIYTFFISL